MCLATLYLPRLDGITSISYLVSDKILFIVNGTYQNLQARLRVAESSSKLLQLADSGEFLSAVSADWVRSFLVIYNFNLKKKL